MKKFLTGSILIFALSAIIPTAFAGGNPPTDVPDVGTTATLVMVSMGGLAFVRHFFSRKG